MSRRIASIDALRGLVMIVMALDHVRDFVHESAGTFQPEDLARTSAPLFLTRWITHICAPVFMLTAGLGAWFYLRNGRTAGQLSRFLWTRGAWLILLELTVLRFGMNFNLTEGVLILTVLWGLGWSMIALGFLSRLPVRVLAVLSVAVIALHNLADSVPSKAFGGFAWLWTVLHQPGAIRVGSLIAIPSYSVIPWAFVMPAGFCLGPVMEARPEYRRSWLIRTGLGLTLAFLVLRAVNVYGDPSPWTGGLLSFLRSTKYPPSLDFLLMTLGPALLMLAWFDRMELARTSPLMVFGRVPLFYFMGHFYLAHLAAVGLALIRYRSAGFLFRPLPWIGGGAGPVPKDYGYSLPVVYAVWIAVVAAMYPACLWFARLKDRGRWEWLSYF